MFDIKALKLAADALEQEKGLPRGKIMEAIEAALAAAYKREFGKKGQIVRCTLDIETGTTEYVQVKVVVDDTMVRPALEGEEEGDMPVLAPKEVATVTSDGQALDENGEPIDLRVRYNPEHHIMIEDAKFIKKGAQIDDEIIFPLDTPEDDFGRIAAQTAKQVIMQKIREAERGLVLDEFSARADEIIVGSVERIERGNIFVNLGKAVAILGRDDQIPSERFNVGDRIRAYLYSVEETPRGVSLRLSRAHPSFVKALFALEAPEIESGVVEIKAVAREPGFRTKIAVVSHDESIDPIGTCVGQRGARVSTVISELSGEKMDIIQWSPSIDEFIESALSPARIASVKIDENEKYAKVLVEPDQLSLAIGRSGQNVRLAARLTGFRIDVDSTEAEANNMAETDSVLAPETAETPEEEMEEFIASDENAMNSEEVNGTEMSEGEQRVVDREVVDDNNSEEK
jgi:N utilization substance protein A